MRCLVRPIEPQVLRAVVGTGIRLRQLARVRRELVAFSNDSGKQIADRAGLEVRFEKALTELSFVYQPIIRWSARAVVGHEVFVRSREPSLADARALRDAAERLGRVPELGRAIRGRCSLPFGPEDRESLLFVSIHELDLLDESLYERTAGLACFAGRVVLQLSECARLESVAEIPRRMRELRLRGFRLALSEFGAGYAGLTSFSNLEPDVVKLDARLVEGVDHALGKRRLLRCEVLAQCLQSLETLLVVIEVPCDKHPPCRVELRDEGGFIGFFSISDACNRR